MTANPRSAIQAGSAESPSDQGQPDTIDTHPADSSKPVEVSTSDESVRQTLETLDLRPRRRRWPIALAGLAVGVVGTLGALAAIDQNGDDDNTTTEEQVALATAPVETRDLLEEVEWAGTLGFGESVSAIAQTDGTFTTTATVGASVARGDVIATIDDLPMVLFYGDQPFFRNLSSGDEGPDVHQLESNLVELGYDPDVTVTIDNSYTANTEAMVERWQEDLGAEITGDFRLGAATLTDGRATVVSAATTGNTARSGDSVAEFDVQQVLVTVVNGAAGIAADFVASDTPITQGTVLYSIDEQPVVALTDPGRIGELLADPGADIETLESLLSSGGFDPDGEMTVDGVVTETTEAAVGRWQSANDLPVTSVADSSGYALVRPGLVAGQSLVLPGSELVAGRPVLSLTAQTMSITLTIVASDADEFAVGDQVDVELADGSLRGGVVTDVGTIVTPGANNDDDATIDVTLALTDGDDSVVAGPVTVLTISTRIDGAMVVPTRALVSLVEGGFAVEKELDDGTTVLIQVEIGTFDEGVVEVESSQLEPGDALVVPS